MEDAKKALPQTRVPTISVPETPVANGVEIRLVEPTPAPSRVGSLGGSINASIFPSREIPPVLKEEVEAEEDENSSSKINITGRRVAISPMTANRDNASSPRRNRKFFVQSSPSKGSASDSPLPSPVTNAALNPPSRTKHGRRSSGDSSSASTSHRRDSTHVSHKRHISLTTMRGKFQAEKRKAAENMAKKQEEDVEEEESGWEDEDQVNEDNENEPEDDENWSDEEEAEEIAEDEPVEEPLPAPSPQDDRERKNKDPNRRRSSSRPRPSRGSVSQPNIGAVLSRRVSWHGDRSREHLAMTRPIPPPPAPTPLQKMSKKERQAAAAERAQIEARLEAQRKREMFAKQQIFGTRPSSGLLASALQRGASMVNLVGVFCSKTKYFSELIHLDSLLHPMMLVLFCGIPPRMDN